MFVTVVCVSVWGLPSVGAAFGFRVCQEVQAAVLRRSAVQRNGDVRRLYSGHLASFVRSEQATLRESFSFRAGLQEPGPLALSSWRVD